MRSGSQRLTGMLLALGFLAGWVSASWVSPPTAVTQTAPRRQVVPPPAVDMPRVALAAVRAPDTVPAVARNPFQFGGAGNTVREAAPAAPAIGRDAVRTTPDSSAVVAPGVAEITVARLPWTLLGIASTDGAATTAVVSGRGDVLLVSVGDRLPDGSDVIGLDAVRLTLRLPSGDTHTLDLP